MLLQTNSYIVPKERRAEHARLIRRFRQALGRLGCDQFEVYEQVGPNWSPGGANGRYVQIMRFRDRQHQQAVQNTERTDPASQQIIAEFCDLINFPYQQQHGYFATGFYTSVLPIGPRQIEYQNALESSEEYADSDEAVGGGEAIGEEEVAESDLAEPDAEAAPTDETEVADDEAAEPQAEEAEALEGEGAEAEAAGAETAEGELSEAEASDLGAGESETAGDELAEAELAEPAGPEQLETQSAAPEQLPGATAEQLDAAPLSEEQAAEQTTDAAPEMLSSEPLGADEAEQPEAEAAPGSALGSFLDSLTGEDLEPHPHMVAEGAGTEQSASTPTGGQRQFAEVAISDPVAEAPAADVVTADAFVRPHSGPGADESAEGGALAEAEMAPGEGEHDAGPAGEFAEDVPPLLPADDVMMETSPRALGGEGEQEAASAGEIAPHAPPPLPGETAVALSSIAGEAFADVAPPLLPVDALAEPPSAPLHDPAASEASPAPWPTEGETPVMPPPLPDEQADDVAPIPLHSEDRAPASPPPLPGPGEASETARHLDFPADDELLLADADPTDLGLEFEDDLPHGSELLHGLDAELEHAAGHDQTATPRVPPLAPAEQSALYDPANAGEESIHQAIAPAHEDSSVVPLASAEVSALYDPANAGAESVHQAIAPAHEDSSVVPLAPAEASALYDPANASAETLHQAIAPPHEALSAQDEHAHDEGELPIAHDVFDSLLGEADREHAPTPLHPAAPGEAPAPDPAAHPAKNGAGDSEDELGDFEAFLRGLEHNGADDGRTH